MILFSDWLIVAGVYETLPKKGGSHRALGDIEESIAELKFYREKIFK